MLTDTAIRKWSSINNDKRQRCGDGLYFCGFVSGRKLFQIRILVNNKRRWIDIDDYPQKTLDNAREIALAAKRIIKSGEIAYGKLQAAILRVSTANELDEELNRGIAKEAGRVGIPSFDQAFLDWYNLQIKANRWTNLVSWRRPTRPRHPIRETKNLWANLGG